MYNSISRYSPATHPDDFAREIYSKYNGPLSQCYFAVHKLAVMSGPVAYYYWNNAKTQHGSNQQSQTNNLFIRFNNLAKQPDQVMFSDVEMNQKQEQAFAMMLRINLLIFKDEIKQTSAFYSQLDAAPGFNRNHPNATTALSFIRDTIVAMQNPNQLLIDSIANLQEVRAISSIFGIPHIVANDYQVATQHEYGMSGSDIYDPRQT